MSNIGDNTNAITIIEQITLMLVIYHFYLVTHIHMCDFLGGVSTRH